MLPRVDRSRAARDQRQHSGAERQLQTCGGLFACCCWLPCHLYGPLTLATQKQAGPASFQRCVAIYSCSFVEWLWHQQHRSSHIQRSCWHGPCGVILAQKPWCKGVFMITAISKPSTLIKQHGIAILAHRAVSSASSCMLRKFHVLQFCNRSMVAST